MSHAQFLVDRLVGAERATTDRAAGITSLDESPCSPSDGGRYLGWRGVMRRLTRDPGDVGSTPDRPADAAVAARP